MNSHLQPATRIILRSLVLTCFFSGVLLAQKPGAPPAPPPPRPTPPAGKSDPEELVKLREQFTLRALSSARMLADQYGKALAGIEAQAADAADYDTALAAQSRRKELADLYTNPALQDSDVIVLKPADAKIVGSITRDQADDTLAGWRSIGSSASWDIYKMTPGTYSVAIVCGVADTPEPVPGAIPNSSAPGALTGGEIEFSEATSLLSADTTKLTAALKSTGGWSTMATLPLGDIKLTHPNLRLMLRASRLRGPGGLMHLKEVRLTPARPSSDADDGSVSEDFAKARAAHKAKLTELEKPLADAYAARMNAFSAALAAKGDDDGAQLAKNEADRATRGLTETDSSTTGGPSGTVTLGGYEEIRNIQFVDDPTNTGDRFLIKADGKQLSVRLLWVTCPSSRAEDKTAQKISSAYFGITLEDSVTIGKRAAEFTAAYLKDKPLRILTRWRKDKRDSILASVHPGDVGDLAGILVDNGLAMINPPAAKGASLQRAEETALSALKDRESAARARPVPPGAWSFSNLPSPQK